MIPTRTLYRFIREQERLHQGTTGELSDLLASIGVGVKYLAEMVSTAGFKGLYDYSGRVNVQDERVRLLDEAADQVLVDVLGSSGHFGLVLSEERDEVVPTPHAGAGGAKYVVAFDPLDGSSNIGSNIPVGTIFTVFRRTDPSRAASADDFLRPGREIVAAGYSVYGAKTSFVYTTGDGVFDFTLERSVGEFVLTGEGLRVPPSGTIVSVNDGNSLYWDRRCAAYVASVRKEDPARGRPYTSRYVGSLVADFDRTLRRGGIFLYPADSRSPGGRLRLLYECVPLAFIMEQAGGTAVDGTSTPVLDRLPSDVHERCGFVAGSPEDVRDYLSE